MSRFSTLIFIFLLSFYQLFAAIELPAVISNGMVLQRDLKVPIWGWGEPGAKVKVSFAGQTQRTEVGSDGKWMVKLDPMDASSESRSMDIKVGSEKVELKDVLVGEVWVCSGQSNMQWTLHGSAQKTRDPKDQPVADWVAAHKKTARDPLLRQIAVPMLTSYDKELNNFKGAWIASTSEDNNNQFTATGYFFALELRKELGVPVGLLKCPWGGKKIQPFIPSTHYKSVPKLKTYYEDAMKNMLKASSEFDPKKAEANFQKALEKWKEKVAIAKKNKKTVPRKPKKATDPKLDANFPSTIYNAMVNPLVPFGIRGALWYQGESNAGSDANMYGEFLEALATSWRDRWDQGDFPLYYVQLAKFRKPPENPVDNDGWVTVCDQMRRTLSFKNMGMAVINDAGEVEDIHPRNKVDPGKRLALWALAKDYGRTDLVYSGPLYESSSFNDNMVTIKFSHVGEGLMTARKHLLDPAKPVNEHVQGFQICGADKAWKWAQARIISPSEVEVYHPDIAKPVEVRYAWASNPENANLYNKSGLPTSCFTTAE